MNDNTASVVRTLILVLGLIATAAIAGITTVHVSYYNNGYVEQSQAAYTQAPAPRQTLPRS